MGGGGVGTALRIGTRARSVTNIGGSVTNIKECDQHRVEKVEIFQLGSDPPHLFSKKTEN